MRCRWPPEMAVPFSPMTVSSPQTVYLNGGTVRSNVVFMAEEDEERVIRCLDRKSVV